MQFFTKNYKLSLPFKPVFSAQRSDYQFSRLLGGWARLSLHNGEHSMFALSLKAQWEREEAPKPAGYLPVSTMDHGQKTSHEAEGNSATAAGRAEVDAEQNKKAPNSKPVIPLSVAQLVVRRGLTALASVLILAIGVAVHITVPPPDLPVHSNFTLNWTNSSTTPSAALNSTLSDM